MPPALPGYSIEMKSDSIEEYSFPNGSFWKEELAQLAEVSHEGLNGH
jgi:L-fuconate dehydratase